MNCLVSIIIVNYNTEELLENCILSIKEKTQDVSYEIIVVDNDSTEGSLNKLIEVFPDVTFKLTGVNSGFGTANNIGAKFAQGKYLFFLNPDTLLINNAVLCLAEYLEANSIVVICGGNMYKRDMSPASSFYDIDFLLYEYKIIFNIPRYTGFNKSQKPQKVGVIVGADLMIRRNVFEELNGFDEDFFMYFEEVELCNRVSKKGFDIMSIPDAEIIHLQGGSAENKNEELQKWSYQEHWYSKFVYFSKTKGRFQTSVLYQVTMLKLKLAVLFYKMKSDKAKLEYWYLKENVINKTFERYKRYLAKI